MGATGSCAGSQCCGMGRWEDWGLTPVCDVVEVKEQLLLFHSQESGFPGRREDRSLRGEFLVEVTDVLPALDGRDEWRSHPLGQQPIPVNSLGEEQEESR